MHHKYMGTTSALDTRPKRNTLRKKKFYRRKRKLTPRTSHGANDCEVTRPKTFNNGSDQQQRTPTFSPFPAEKSNNRVTNSRAALNGACTHLHCQHNMEQTAKAHSFCRANIILNNLFHSSRIPHSQIHHQPNYENWHRFILYDLIFYIPCLLRFNSMEPLPTTVCLEKFTPLQIFSSRLMQVLRIASLTQRRCNRIYNI